MRNIYSVLNIFLSKQILYCFLVEDDRLVWPLTVNDGCLLQICMQIKPSLFDKRPLIFASAFGEKGHEIYKLQHFKAPSINRKQSNAMMWLVKSIWMERKVSLKIELCWSRWFYWYLTLTGFPFSNLIARIICWGEGGGWMGLEATMSLDNTSFELFSTFHTAGRVVGFNVKQNSNISVSTFVFFYSKSRGISFSSWKYSNGVQQVHFDPETRLIYKRSLIP